MQSGVSGEQALARRLCYLDVGLLGSFVCRGYQPAMLGVQVSSRRFARDHAVPDMLPGLQAGPRQPHLGGPLGLGLLHQLLIFVIVGRDQCQSCNGREGVRDCSMQGRGHSSLYTTVLLAGIYARAAGGRGAARCGETSPAPSGGRVAICNASTAEEPGEIALHRQASVPELQRGIWKVCGLWGHPQGVVHRTP